MILTGNPRFPLKGSFKGDVDLDMWLSGLLLKELYLNYHNRGIG